MRNKREKNSLVALVVLVFGSFLISSCGNSDNTANSNTSKASSSSSPATSSASGGYERSAIEVQRNDQTTTIDFNRDEIRLFDEETQAGNSEATAEYINGKLAAAGVKCCEPRKRLDSCVWQCCDKSLVKIPDCNTQLRLALEKTLGK
jgi:hypothetical protein